MQARLPPEALIAVANSIINTGGQANASFIKAQLQPYACRAAHKAACIFLETILETIMRTCLSPFSCSAQQCPKRRAPIFGRP